MIDVHRVAAEILGVPWEQCEVVWGNTSKHLPWTCVVGRQPDDARDDARGARRRHATRRSMLQEIAAKTLGGSAGELSGRQRAVSGGGRSMTLRAGGAEGDRARRQVRRPRAAGGRQRLDEDARWPALAGQGLIAAARDNYPRDGQSRSYVAGFAEVEVDVETGALQHPRFHGRRRRRHGHQPAQPAGPDLRRRRCSASATRSVRSGSTTSTTACRSPSGSTTTSRRRFSMRRASFNFGGARHPRSGNAGRRARHRRAAGRRRLRRGAERDRGAGRRRDVPADAGDGGHDSDGARSRPAGARTVDGEYLIPEFDNWVIGSG